MTKKHDMFDMLNSLGSAKGRKKHEDMVNERLREVLEKQRNEGFYSTEDTSDIEEYIKSKED